MILLHYIFHVRRAFGQSVFALILIDIKTARQPSREVLIKTLLRQLYIFREYSIQDQENKQYFSLKSVEVSAHVGCERGQELKTHLDNGRASSDGVVVDELITAGENDVRLASESGRDYDGDATRDGMSLNKCRASDGDEGGIDLLALGALEGIVLPGVST